jgi:PPOX class probable F420-dependent enzyme
LWRVEEKAMADGTPSSNFAALAGQKYINLTTFRRDGSPVVTPVWFAREGDALYITTYDGTGKVKRLRANERVELAPSDARGKVRGPVQTARGRVVADAGEAACAEAALRRTYGWQYRVIRLLMNLASRRRTGGAARIYLALAPA